MYRASLLLIVSMLFVLRVAAEDAPQAPDLEALPDVPPPPERVQSGETLEPEVTIIQKDDATVEEYRVNGNLYMVKVVPVVGKPYYLMDQDGDGKLEDKMTDLYNNFTVPQWVLFSW